MGQTLKRRRLRVFLNSLVVAGAGVIFACEEFPDYDDPRDIPVEPSGVCSGEPVQCGARSPDDCGTGCTEGVGCIGQDLCGVSQVQRSCELFAECTWGMGCVGESYSETACEDLTIQSRCENIRGCTWDSRS